MNQSEHSYFEDEISNMQGVDIQTLISSRLEDITDQIRCLYANGYYEDAIMLREEGLQLAQAYDNEESFLYLNDLTEV